ncbi:MAG: hypothetical protein J0L79_05440 [Rickettsiales bacterium]|nr:hypothetical protein [Rickettsiales bacterium]MCA0254001.1 hypothetical protein [Pseudomonadota bacterium]
MSNTSLNYTFISPEFKLSLQELALLENDTSFLKLVAIALTSAKKAIYLGAVNISLLTVEVVEWLLSSDSLYF